MEAQLVDIFNPNLSLKYNCAQAKYLFIYLSNILSIYKCIILPKFKMKYRFD